jgi:hypothetical protein
MCGVLSLQSIYLSFVAIFCDSIVDNCIFGNVTILLMRPLSCSHFLKMFFISRIQKSWEHVQVTNEHGSKQNCDSTDRKWEKSSSTFNACSSLGCCSLSRSLARFVVLKRLFNANHSDNQTKIKICLNSFVSELYDSLSIVQKLNATVLKNIRRIFLLFFNTRSTFFYYEYGDNFRQLLRNERTAY